MVFNPSLYITTTYNGITAWALNVLPCILPFMIFTKLLSNLGNLDILCRPFAKPCKLLFNTSQASAYVFFMAIISGYPVGAKMTSDLYLQGKITQSDAYRMTSFCSTSGPMFIVGSVGAMMFHSTQIGYLILISHIFGAILNGVLYRKLALTFKGQPQNPKSTPQNDFSQIIVDSILSILSVGVIIAIFFVIITAFNPIFSIFPSPIKELLQGGIEITRGCIELAKLSNIRTAIILASFVIGFGGISTILQSMTFLEKIKMPVKFFILQKLTHGILSALIMFPLSFLI